MTKVADDQIHATIREQSGIDTRCLEFRCQRPAGCAQSRRPEDPQQPYLPTGLAVVGALYDVRTGRIDVLVPAER